MHQSHLSTFLEEEYSKVLDLRERLRVEEIVSEVRPDMQQLYLDPPTYLTSQNHLRDVRILIIETCQALAYIESEIPLHNLNLDLSAIDHRRICQRPSNHPYNMISAYLKPTAWKQLNNYAGFFNLGQINGGIGSGDWDALSASDSIEYKDSGSSATIDPLDSDYSRFLGAPDKYLPPADKQVYLSETYSNIAADHWPDILAGESWRPGVTVRVFD